MLKLRTEDEYTRSGERVRAFVRRLSSLGTLNKDDEQLIASVCDVPVRYAASKTAILPEGGPLLNSCVLLRGWAARFMGLPDGRRQLVDLLLPGDMFSRPILGLCRDHSVTALSNCAFIQLDGRSLERLSRRPGIARALSTQAGLAEFNMRNWILGLGCRNALERIGHLFCELYVRMRCIGALNGGSFHFPLTQTELAEATGLTAVHVNRVLQELRARALLRLENRTLVILDFTQLADLVMFNQAYCLPEGGSFEGNCEEV